MLNLEGLLHVGDILDVNDRTDLRFKDRLKFKTPEALVLHEQGILPDAQIKSLCESVYGFELHEPINSYIPDDVIRKFEGTEIVPVNYQPMQRIVTAVKLPEFPDKFIDVPGYTVNVLPTTVYYYFEKFQKYFGNPAHLSSIPVKMLFNDIVHEALVKGATDITISTNYMSTYVYYRVRKRKVRSHKIFYREFAMDVIKMVTQNSPFDFGSRSPKDVDYDLNDDYRGRINILPKFDGFTITIRLLPNKSYNTSLEQWNLTPTSCDWLRKNMLDSEPGLRLIVGETESGKNTVALSLLMEVASDENKKIMSMEMPVEQRLDGVEQVSSETIDELVDAIHSLVRQNPDIVYIAEIRDKTALPIIQVTNTGKWVLSTLHANSIADTISRLVDITGLSQDRIIQAIHSICWQKLVRDDVNDRVYPIDRFVRFTDEVKYALYGKSLGEIFRIISDIEEGDA